jgi:hypothetical protein
MPGPDPGTPTRKARRSTPKPSILIGSIAEGVQDKHQHNERYLVSAATTDLAGIQPR